MRQLNAACRMTVASQIRFHLSREEKLTRRVRWDRQDNGRRVSKRHAKAPLLKIFRILKSLLTSAIYLRWYWKFFKHSYLFGSTVFADFYLFKLCIFYFTSSMPCLQAFLFVLLKHVSFLFNWFRFGDTGITGVVTCWLTGGKMSSPSQRYLEYWVFIVYVTIYYFK